MTRQEAMEELGCENFSELARALDITPAAVSQWKDPLPESVERRVMAKLYKRIPKRARKPQ